MKCCMNLAAAAETQSDGAAPALPDPSLGGECGAEQTARQKHHRQRGSPGQSRQSSRPQVLAYGLSDSPAGLLAWISDLFTSFGDAPEAVDRDTFLTNFMIYWFTGTAASSIRFYYENAHDPNAWTPKANSGVPTGVAVFGRDEVPIRRYGEQGNTIVRWTEFDRGGHYAVIEEPALWTGEVRAFFAGL